MDEEGRRGRGLRRGGMGVVMAVRGSQDAEVVAELEDLVLGRRPPGGRHQEPHARCPGAPP